MVYNRANDAFNSSTTVIKDSQEHVRRLGSEDEEEHSDRDR